MVTLTDTINRFYSRGYIFRLQSEDCSQICNLHFVTGCMSGVSLSVSSRDKDSHRLSSGNLVRVFVSFFPFFCCRYSWRSCFVCLIFSELVYIVDTLFSENICHFICFSQMLNIDRQFYTRSNRGAIVIMSHF